MMLEVKNDQVGGLPGGGSEAWECEVWGRIKPSATPSMPAVFFRHSTARDLLFLVAMLYAHQSAGFHDSGFTNILYRLDRIDEAVVTGSAREHGNMCRFQWLFLLAVLCLLS
jgi:hypothetical protein